MTADEINARIAALEQPTEEHWTQAPRNPVHIYGVLYDCKTEKYVLADVFRLRVPGRAYSLDRAGVEKLIDELNMEPSE